MVLLRKSCCLQPPDSGKHKKACKIPVTPAFAKKAKGIDSIRKKINN